MVLGGIMCTQEKRQKWAAIRVCDSYKRLYSQHEMPERLVGAVNRVCTDVSSTDIRQREPPSTLA